MDIMIPTATPDKNIDKNVFVSSFRFVLATTKPIRKFGIVCKTVLSSSTLPITYTQLGGLGNISPRSSNVKKKCKKRKTAKQILLR